MCLAIRMVLAATVLVLLCVQHSSVSTAAARASQTGVTSRRCPQVDGNSESCVCRSPKGVIDLRALSNRNGTARFKNVNDDHFYLYDFNPCQAFDSNCINVHICQTVTVAPGIYYSIADQGTEEIWIDSELGPYLHYTGAGNREVRVYLHCEETGGEDVLTSTGDSKTRLSYVFDLYSCHACPGGCDGDVSSRLDGMIGWTLIILLSGGFMCYLLFGMTFKYCCYGLRGRETIPHREYWNELPYLVQDGYFATVEVCCPFVYDCMYNRRRRNEKQQLVYNESDL